MYFSAHWLARYVELPDGIDELAEILTRTGMVVEEQRRHGDDTVFDLDIPTNRADAMNHIGVAREIATARRVALDLPTDVAAESDTAAETLSSVLIEDLEGCPRYVARVVEGVDIAPSPQWLVDLIEAIGLRPLNNVADITNFVMWEYGHPLHAFDYDKLAENRIVVRRAHDGEKLVTLDDVERTLDPADVVIADAEKAVALGGVMGGAETAISDATTNVLLEGAWFDPAAVRATAQRLNLHTDASHRFERSPAHDGMLAALDRAASLVVELAGGTLATGRIDVKGELPAPTTVTLRPERLRGLLGIDVDGDDIEDILGRLGFAVRRDDAGYAVEVPAYRPDVRMEEDLIEEVGRHIGYDRLPATLPVIRAVGETATPEVLGEQRLKQALVAAGCQEAMSSSLSSAAEQSVFVADEQDLVTLQNPISEGYAVLRAHVSPGLLEAVAHNLNHGQRSLRLFEVGRCFAGPLTDDGVNERWGLGIALCGDRGRPHWAVAPRTMDFFDLKGIVEAVTERMAWPAWSWRGGERLGMDPGATAVLGCSDPDVPASGWAGRLDPATARAHDIDVDVWIAELDVDALLSRPHPTAHYSPASRYPGGTRDVALHFSTDASYDRVAAVARGAAKDADLPLRDVSLVEIYAGDRIPPGRRGMTLRFSFRADDRTLTAEEIDSAQHELVEAVIAGCDAERR